MSEAVLSDERGCTAQSRGAYHYWTQTLTCAPRRLTDHDQGQGMRSKGRISGRGPRLIYLRLGATPCGATKKCCASMPAKLASGGSDQIRALGSADPRHTCPAFCPQGAHLRRGHGPPPRRTAGTTLRSTLAEARGIICERVRAPAGQEMWRWPVIRERAAGVRLRLRAFYAVWDAVRHQSWFKAETMDALV